MSCEYHEKGRPVKTEIDGDGYMLIYDPDPEYHMDGFAVDVYRYLPVEREGEWLMSFMIPCCPMCGAKAGDAR